VKIPNAFNINNKKMASLFVEIVKSTLSATLSLSLSIYFSPSNDGIYELYIVHNGINEILEVRAMGITVVSLCSMTLSL